MQFQLSGKTIICKVCEEKSAMEEEYNGIRTWLCVNCGYMTSDNLIENSTELTQSPKSIQKLKIWDDDKKVYWIPSVINMPKKGILFPESIGKSIIWTLVPIIEIPEDERKNYPIGNATNTFHTHKMDPSLSKKFTRFYDAIVEMGAVIKLDKMEN